MKPLAAGCCMAGVLAYLFLPLIKVKLTQIGITGLDSVSFSLWGYLPLLTGIGMAAAALLAPGKAAAAVNAVGAFVPLLTFLLIRSVITGDAAALAGFAGAENFSSAGAAVLSAALTAGFGPVLAMLFGFGSAVLCFLSDSSGRTNVKRTPGLGAEPDEDW